jgi:hypothetical protein
MPWVKGQSGNPSGLRKRSVREMARKYTRAAIRTLAFICGDPEDPEMPGAEEAKDRVAAAKALLDRGWGPPDAPVLSEIPDDELRAEVERRIALERTGGEVEAEPAPPH